MCYATSPILLDPSDNGKPIIWIPAQSSGRSASDCRTSVPSVVPQSSAYYPARIDLSLVSVGDMIGSWTVTAIQTGETRRHGYPCHCVWDNHSARGECSYDNPDCPCYEMTTWYRFTCQCICGTVKGVSASDLLTGTSLSCGRFRGPVPVKCA